MLNCRVRCKCLWWWMNENRNFFQILIAIKNSSVKWAWKISSNILYQHFSQIYIHCYRNWPRYGLRWSGWYCHQAQHELCRPSRGRLRPRRPAQRVLCLMAVPPTTARTVSWSISILPRSQFYKKQGKLAFSTSCTAVRPHRRLRNDAWRRDS